MAAPRRLPITWTLTLSVGLLIIAAACRAAVADGGDRIVSSPNELQAALRNARPGSTISLAPGTYGDLALRRLDRGGVVHIVSARHDARAVFSGLLIDKSANLIIKDIELSNPPPPPAVAHDSGQGEDLPNGQQVGAPARHKAAALVILDSQHIRVEGLLVRSAPAEGQVGRGNGVMIRGSSDISVVESEFRNLVNGLSHLDSDHLTIERNLFHDIKIDGIHGGGSSNVVVSHNVFWNFFRAPGDHPDAVQFWTTNTHESARDITVRGNLIMRGAGGPMQGIFVTDQSKGRLPYEDVSITDNAIVGSMYHGINLFQARSPEVRRNLVVGYDDMKSWIMIAGATEGNVSDNKATSFHFEKGNEGVRFEHNKTVSTPRVGDKRALQRWYADHAGELPALPPDALAFIQ